MTLFLRSNFDARDLSRSLGAQSGQKFGETYGLLLLPLTGEIFYADKLSHFLLLTRQRPKHRSVCKFRLLVLDSCYFNVIFVGAIIIFLSQLFILFDVRLKSADFFVACLLVIVEFCLCLSRMFFFGLTRSLSQQFDCGALLLLVMRRREAARIDDDSLRWGCHGLLNGLLASIMTEFGLFTCMIKFWSDDFFCADSRL